MIGTVAFALIVLNLVVLAVVNKVTIAKTRKEQRQQLESKTPYDYALANAINERDRLQDELRTIQALKRTERSEEAHV